MLIFISILISSFLSKPIHDSFYSSTCSSRGRDHNRSLHWRLKHRLFFFKTWTLELSYACALLLCSRQPPFDPRSRLIDQHLVPYLANILFSSAAPPEVYSSQ